MSQRPMAPYYDRVVQTESRNNPDAVSPKGARGRMQIMPTTGRDPGFGIKPWDGTDADNVRIGRDYLDKMHERYRNPTDALMAYNWGPGAVDSWIKNGRNPNAVPKETRNYVKQITGMPVSGPQGTGNTAMLLMDNEEQGKPAVAPTLAPNPNAPALAETQPVLTQAMMQGALGPQATVADNSSGMTELDALNKRVDDNVMQRQAGVLGPDAAAFAREKGLPLNSREVLDFAAKRNVGALQKGLSFLQGVVGLPFGILGNALGEKMDYTSAFTPERAFKTRAQEAIASLDTMGITAKTEIAGMRQDVRKSIFDAVQPAVKEAYDTFGKRQISNIGETEKERFVNAALIKEGYRDQYGNVDRSSPAARQFALDLETQWSTAENAGKPRGGSGGGAERERWFEVLKNADPNSREYATAYGVLSAPKVVTTPEGSFTYPGLDLTGMGYTSPAGAPAPTPGAPAPTPGAPAPGVPVGMPAGAARIGAATPNEYEQKMAGFFGTATKADAIVNKLFNEGFDISSTGESFRSTVGEGLNAVIPGSLGDRVERGVKSEPRQSFEQASNDFVDAVIRARTGAGLNVEEPKFYKETYLPQPGDGPAVIKQKAKSRTTFLQETEAQARRAMGPKPQYGNAPVAGGNSNTGGASRIVIGVDGKVVKKK